MRTIFASFAALLLASAARAEDTRPPQISDVKSSSKGGKVTIEARITDETGVLSAICHHRSPGGKVEESPMIKNEYDDVFKVTFPGGSDTEYWIESSDLLGNGPSTYGSSSKPFAAGGGKGGGKISVASNEPPGKREPPVEDTAPVQEGPKREHHHLVKAPQPPVIEHRKPGTQPPDGSDFTLRMRIKSQSPVAVAILQARPQGSGAAFNNISLKKTEGESYEAEIPGSLAHGTVEYFIAAKDQAGMMTRQGDGDAKTPYLITFKPTAAVPVAPVTPTPPPAGGPAPAAFTFTDLPPFRVPPGRPILLRAQVVPSTDEGLPPHHVSVLWRGNDAQDQITDMVPDNTGGLGGYKAELPPQDEGAVFYQIVACDSQSSRCGVDTGSKHKWHATAVASSPGGRQPLPLETVSSKAPPSLPE